MPDFSLDTIDFVTIGIYIIAIMAIGIWVSRKTETSDDYFLAGRSLTWFFIGSSLLASNISSSSLIGMAGSAYKSGISVYNYEWMAGLILVVFAVFFIPFYLKSRVFTMPEFLERRFDSRSRYYFSGMTIVGNIFIDTAGSLYAGGLVIQLLYPEVPFVLSVTALALIAGLYTIVGGLKAVVYTDAIQAVLLIFGATLITILAFTEVGSWETAMAATTAEMMSLVKPVTDDFLPWPGLLFGVPLLGFYFWCTNQFMVQRVLGAKDINNARWGALFAGFMKLFVIFIMVFPGIFALTLYPSLPAEPGYTPDLVFPVLLFDLLPAGIRGIILVALIAAIMSSIDSTLNSASTLVTMDFAKKLKPDMSQKKLVLTGRIVTLLFMIISATWAPMIRNFPSLWEYLQSVLAYQAPPFVAAFVLGVFWKRTTDSGAFYGILGGHITSFILFLMINVFGVFDLHFLYVAPVLLVVSLLIMVVVSNMTEAPSFEKIKDLVWTRELFASESEELKGMPWFKNYRYQSIIILVLTAVIIGTFW
ncbi:MAG TPA: sodium transporter [Balneolaceae bacterium]|nr:sodium transporter [Balneolaceae bacterium]|tara:strand:+ start:135927 stop:137525 length:1599 start_codon:yes stop_codon:yes gene_type:complete